MQAFTVIIPTHNRPQYLEQALASILCQTGERPRIIVVDDNSEKPAIELMDPAHRLACEYLRNSPGRGVSSARNQGAAMAESEWLVFLDDDDWLAPDFFSAVQACIARNAGKVDLVWSTKIPVKESALKSSGVPAVKLSATTNTATNSDTDLAGLMDVTCSGMAIRCDAFAAVGGFDQALSVSEDRDLIFKLLSNGCRAVQAPEAGLFFRIHDGPRLSRSDQEERQARADLTVLKRHRSFLIHHPMLADHFLGRVARRLWHSNYLHDALAVNQLQRQINPRALRPLKRQFFWRSALVFKKSLPAIYEV